jgi:hypothetical protein
MKKIITKISLLLLVISSLWILLIENVNAESNTIKVAVTEEIPWANCQNISEWKKDESWNLLPPKYECEIEQGFGTIIKMLGQIIKYFTYIASLGGVLFIVINGIMYSMWWADWELKEGSKKRIIQALIGLILLFLSGVILYLIAPWIYKL